MNSVKRVTKLMELLMEDGGELGIREIAERSGIPKSTVQRILDALRKSGWLVQSPRTQGYRVALRFLLFSNSWRLRQELLLQAGEVMSELCERSGQTVLLLVLDGVHGICLNKVEPARTIKLVADVGKTFPLHAAACGKILLAYAPEELKEKIYSSPLKQYTPKTITEVDVLKKEMADIRARRCAVSVEELTSGAAELAVPILDREENLVAGLSIAGPLFEVARNREGLEEMLRCAASRIIGETPV